MEMALHGDDVDNIISVYNKGGMEAVNAFRNNDLGGKGDHSAIKNNDINHSGVEAYNSVKDDLIKKDNNYKAEFKRAEDRYQKQY